MSFGDKNFVYDKSLYAKQTRICRNGVLKKTDKRQLDGKQDNLNINGKNKERSLITKIKISKLSHFEHIL